MKNSSGIKLLTVTAVLTAMNVVFSSFSVPVPGGHLYLNDIVICLASLLLGPIPAFFVGGIGAFLGDLFFYPTTMFVSLVVRGLQAVTISVYAKHFLKSKGRTGAIIGLILGGIIMVVGYSFGRAYFYATPEYAWLKLPWQIGMAVLGIATAPILAWTCGLEKLFHRIFGKK